jgi:hypothetical protein
MLHLFKLYNYVVLISSIQVSQFRLQKGGENMWNIFNLSTFLEDYNGSNMAGFEQTDFGKYAV